MTAMRDADSIGALFSLLHDGVIVGYAMQNGTLELVVEIKYLAQRLQGLRPGDVSLRISLVDVRDLSFKTWPKDAAAAPALLRALPEIFAPPLAILSGEVRDDGVMVLCNQPGRDCTHCGGELYFSASGAIVTDPAGRRHSLDALRALAQGYWDAWGGQQTIARTGG
jgi:hypothetical protein